MTSDSCTCRSWLDTCASLWPNQNLTLSIILTISSELLIRSGEKHLLTHGTGSLHMPLTAYPSNTARPHLLFEGQPSINQRLWFLWASETSGCFYWLSQGSGGQPNLFINTCLNLDCPSGTMCRVIRPPKHEISRNHEAWFIILWGTRKDPCNYVEYIVDKWINQLTHFHPCRIQLLPILLSSDQDVPLLNENDLMKPSVSIAYTEGYGSCPLCHFAWSSSCKVRWSNPWNLILLTCRCERFDHNSLVRLNLLFW